MRGWALAAVTATALLAAGTAWATAFGLSAQSLTATTVQAAPATPALSFSAIGPISELKKAGTMTVGYPSGTVANDALLLVVVNNANQLVKSAPAGWTLVAQQATKSPQNFVFGVWWRVAGSTDSSVDVAVGTDATGAAAWVVRYARSSGFTSPPVLAVASGGVVSGLTGAASTLTPSPDLVTNLPTARVISLVAVRAGNALTLAAPQGFSVVTSATTSISVVDTLGVADTLQSAAATVPAPTWGQGGTAAQWAWVTVAIA